MRLAVLALSAAMITGCSYGGSQGSGFSNFFKGPSQGHYNAQSSAPRCVVPHRQAPAPRGCHPSQVRIAAQQQGQYGQAQAGNYGAAAGGFPQTPQYTTGAYGSHASGNAHTGHHQGQTKPKSRRPNFRASLDLGIEQSVSGNILDYSKAPLSPAAAYNPGDYTEGTVSGTAADGTVTRTTWRGNSRLSSNPNSFDEISMPSISFDDAWSAPATIGAGGEYIINDKATLFARVGYTRSEGTTGNAVSVEGTVFQDVTTESYDDTATLIASSTSTTFDVGHNFTDFSYDFTDMERIDLEAGGRFYMNPISGQGTGRTVTPFVGASAGVSRYNDVSYTIDQNQLSFQSVFDGADGTESYDLDVLGYDLDNNPATPASRTVDLYDSQWVATGSIKAGVEWQMTSKTALAFETGLRVEGAREYSNGTRGDSNIAVPVTLRGSFNF